MIDEYRGLIGAPLFRKEALIKMSTKKTKKIQILGTFPQSDWAETDETKSTFIKNKPDLGAYATQDWVKEYVDSIAANIPIYSGAYEEV